jgi:hypothetical protein
LILSAVSSIPWGSRHTSPVDKGRGGDHSILISGTENFRIRTVIRVKEENYIMINRSILQKDIIPIMFAFYKRMQKYIR